MNGYNPMMYQFNPYQPMQPQQLPDAQTAALNRAGSLSQYDPGQRAGMNLRAQNQFGGNMGAMQNYDAANQEYEQRFNSLGQNKNATDAYFGNQAMNNQMAQMQQMLQMMGMGGFNPGMFNYGGGPPGQLTPNQIPQRGSVSVAGHGGRQGLRRYYQPGIGR